MFREGNEINFSILVSSGFRKRPEDNDKVPCHKIQSSRDDQGSHSKSFLATHCKIVQFLQNPNSLCMAEMTAVIPCTAGIL